MAKLMLIGNLAQVEILTDPEDEELTLARCAGHPTVLIGGGVAQVPCDWTERYDSTPDAINYAVDHADTGRI